MNDTWSYSVGQSSAGRAVTAGPRRAAGGGRAPVSHSKAVAVRTAARRRRRRRRRETSRYNLRRRHGKSIKRRWSAAAAAAAASTVPRRHRWTALQVRVARVTRDVARNVYCTCFTCLPHHVYSYPLPPRPLRSRVPRVTITGRRVYLSGEIRSPPPPPRRNSIASRPPRTCCVVPYIHANIIGLRAGRVDGRVKHNNIQIRSRVKRFVTGGARGPIVVALFGPNDFYRLRYYDDIIIIIIAEARFSLPVLVTQTRVSQLLTTCPDGLFNGLSVFKRTQSKFRSRSIIL